MPKNSFLDWSTTASSNTDIGGIGTQGTNLVSNFDDAFRTLMAQLRSGVDGKTVYASKSGAYTAVANDNNGYLRFTATATLSLTAVATLGANWHIFVQADGGDVTVDPDSSETINGATTITVRNGESALIISTGSAFFARVNSVATYNTLSGDKLPGFLSGLTLSNNASDATNDIDIAVGSAAADTSPYYLMQLGSGLTKRLDAAWAVGTGNGGLDTGTIANTAYFVWLIQRSDTGVVDALFSASPTSPTMPTNYDRKRRIGAIIRSSGAILAFSQTGDTFLLSVPVQNYNTTNPGTSGTAVALTVPPFIFCAPIFSARLQASTTNTSILITSILQADTAPGPFTFRTIAGSGSAQGGIISDLLVPGSSLIRFRLDNSDASTTVTLTTFGWKDTRGRS